MSIGDALKPIPTEYKGTVFRSKSEAILARCFDLNRNDWIYEPGIGGINSDHMIPDHDWDFVVHYGQCVDYLVEYRICIEYKPRKPTETYICNLENKIMDFFSGEREAFFRLQQQLKPDFRNIILENEVQKQKFGKSLYDVSHDLTPTFYFLIWGSAWDEYCALPIGSYPHVHNDLAMAFECELYDLVAEILFSLNSNREKAKSFRFDLP